MELVKAVARRHGPKTLWTDGINRPIRIGPVVESRKVRVCCRHFQVLEDLPVSLAQVAPYCAISISGDSVPLSSQHCVAGNPGLGWTPGMSSAYRFGQRNRHNQSQSTVCCCFGSMAATSRADVAQSVLWGISG